MESIKKMVYSLPWPRVKFLTLRHLCENPVTCQVLCHCGRSRPDPLGAESPSTLDHPLYATSLWTLVCIPGKRRARDRQGQCDVRSVFALVQASLGCNTGPVHTPMNIGTWCREAKRKDFAFSFPRCSLGFCDRKSTTGCSCVFR